MVLINARNAHAPRQQEKRAQQRLDSLVGSGDDRDVEPTRDEVRWMFSHFPSNVLPDVLEEMLGFDLQTRQEETAQRESFCTSRASMIFELKSVLYYKRHNKSAMPSKGIMRLEQGTLSFRCKGHDFCWDLVAIEIEKFQGRMNPGMKVRGRTREEGGDVGAAAPAQEEYTFTRVSPQSLEVILGAVAAAKALQASFMAAADGRE